MHEPDGQSLSREDHKKGAASHTESVGPKVHCPPIPSLAGTQSSAPPQHELREVGSPGLPHQPTSHSLELSQSFPSSPPARQRLAPQIPPPRQSASGAQGAPGSLPPRTGIAPAACRSLAESRARESSRERGFASSRRPNQNPEIPDLGCRVRGTIVAGRTILTEAQIREALNHARKAVVRPTAASPRVPERRVPGARNACGTRPQGPVSRVDSGLEGRRLLDLPGSEIYRPRDVASKLERHTYRDTPSGYWRGCSEPVTLDTSHNVANWIRDSAAI